MLQEFFQYFDICESPTCLCGLSPEIVCSHPSACLFYLFGFRVYKLYKSKDISWYNFLCLIRILQHYADGSSIVSAWNLHNSRHTHISLTSLFHKK